MKLIKSFKNKFTGKNFCKLILIASCVTSLSCLISGCGDSDKMQRAKEYMQKIDGKNPKPIEPIPEVTPLTTKKYLGFSLRNPFEREKTNTPSVYMPDLRRPKSALENYTLDSLKMVGLMSANNKTWAIISTPDNLVFLASVGDYLGQNYGKIVAIQDKKIDLIESIQVAGDWQKRETSLALITTENSADKKNKPVKKNN